ncbi:MAG: hypothetical protein ABW022_28500 [Actinoplanes sp.]
MLSAAAVAVVVAGFFQDSWPNRIAMMIGGIGILPIAGAVLSKAAGSGWFGDLTSRVSRPFARRPRLFKATATVVVALVCSGSVSAYGEPIAVGDIAAVRVHGATTLVFTPPGGGMAACSHKNKDWRKRWFGIAHHRSWQKIDAYAAMSSNYGGIEVLARRGKQLMFGWRDNELRWHPLRRVDNLSVASGRPALVEWGAARDETRAFLGFVPEGKNIRVHAREDFRTAYPFRWFRLKPIAVPGPAPVDSVTATVLDDNHLLLVVRSGSRLVELTGEPKLKPGGMTIRWSAPKVIRPAGVAVIDPGDPDLILTDSISQGDIVMAVPESEGVLLLSKSAAGSWAAEKVPVDGPVDSLALVDAVDASGRTLVLVFRRAINLHQIYRSDDGRWHGPLELKCHHAATKAPTAD